jgi:hypothetical protein
MSVFHSVPGVPCKNETLCQRGYTNLRFASARLEKVFGVKRSFAYVELTFG